MVPRSQVLKYLIEEYFEGAVERAAQLTGYSRGQFESWLSGKRIPNKKTVEYIIHCIFTPEFKVIVEFAEFDPAKKVATQLKEMLKGHEQCPGIYAFYDSMANLIYVGKAVKLLRECNAAICRTVHIPFPKGIKTKPERRTEIVRYISAYDVGKSNWLDYPKHVESLILRISKPILNKNIGTLDKTYVIPVEDQ